MAIALLRVLSRRLRPTSQTVEDAAFLDVPARLAIVILRLLDEQGQADQAAVVLNARLRQSDLAGMVGTRRETLNRWLRFYEDRGLIRFEQGAITVLQPERLRKRVY